MAPCSICACETCDVPIPRNPNGKYSAGDVYTVRESVYMPINLILKETFGAGSAAFHRSCLSLKDLTSTPDVIRGGRPAIITEDQDDDPQGVWVCVATTYSGEDISNLPFIFRHFSIPIAPNMGHGHGDHVHGLPQWDKPNAFVIGWPFRSKATREGVWTAQVDGEEVPQVLGKEAMAFLIAECERKAEEWWEMCRNPATAAELEADLRASATNHIQHSVWLTRTVQDHVRKRFYSGAGSRAASFEAISTGVDAPWWRKQATIPEETENDFILVTSAKPRGPMPWKSSGKHRTGSTSSFGSAWAKGEADKNSIKSTRSRKSLAQKSQNEGSRFGFDVLRAVRVNAG